VNWLVFDAGAVTHVDSTGLDALDQLAKDLRRDEIELVVARLHTRIGEQFADAGVTETIGKNHFYPTIRAAVAACARMERAG
jgi:anti-anti-sigma regulatory factor